MYHLLIYLINLFIHSCEKLIYIYLINVFVIHLRLIYLNKLFYLMYLVYSFN